jgi:succinate-semialdehyde dehydrogenase/glutarate-semialdehyde dehydrogenase
MKLDDGIPAIPLWIDGHAWFSVFEEFIDIREADGEVRYRVPKCGADEVERALLSAREAQPEWSEDLALREKLLAELAALLDQFGGDFAKLIARETGKEVDASREEVSHAVTLLSAASCASGGGGLQAVFSNAVAPLLSVVEGLVRAVTAGDTAVVLSDARSPSVVFALAELTARAEFPAGVLCLLHGDGKTHLALERALEG